jgi:hypothetical protein
MSNYNIGSVPTTSNTTCCEDAAGEEVAPRPEDDVLVTVVYFTIFGLCVLIFLSLCIFGFFRRKTALAEVEEDVVASHQESTEERTRERRESVSNRLIVKEWVPHDPPAVESTEEGDQDTPPSGEKTDDARQPPAPTINSSTVSCVMGSDDCESLEAGEDERAGCAICLSHFKPQQLVCEASNSSCQHVYHKDCMFDWLMEDHDDCPMCREVYLLKTV